MSCNQLRIAIIVAVYLSGTIHGRQQRFAALDRTRDYVNIRILLQGLLIEGNSIYHGMIIAVEHVSITY